VTVTNPDVPSRRLRLASGPEVRVIERGAGEPRWLLVHGLASNARLWDGVARRLVESGASTVAVDQRGHGLSDRPDDGYDMATVADDLAHLADALGWESALLAGQSWGGNVVLEALARHPERFLGAVCVDGGFIRLRDRFEILEGMWNHDPIATISGVEAPVHVIAADNGDRRFDKSTAVDQLVDAAVDTEVTWFRPAHHDVHAQQPEAVSEVLRRFAERVAT
jgi:pimeloyl-ACP methyl ester carboxylesterase